MRNPTRLFAVLIATLLATIAALLLIGSFYAPVIASPQACDPILYVDHNGGCGGQTPCFMTVQEAVDSACVGREIRVRQGTYTGVQVRNSVTQVVYISKSVTIRGGYSVGDWTTAHPDTQPTILDAQGQGRVGYVIGTGSNRITPTLQGLRMTGGSVTGTRGGGLYAEYADLVISGCHIYSNTASGPGSSGGGLYVEEGFNVILTGNHVYSNSTSGSGGGLCLASTFDALLEWNHIYTNTAVGWAGGGLYASGCDRIELEDNHIHSNLSNNTGGGVWLSHCDDATLTDNRIHDNVASDGDGGGVYARYGDNPVFVDNLVHHNQALGTWSDGGGLTVYESPRPELTGNRVYSNTAGRNGGGISIDECDNARLTRNQVYGNFGDYFGGGIHIVASSSTEVQDNEIHNNSGPIYGGGAYINFSPYLTVEGNRVNDNQSGTRGGGIFLTTESDSSTLANNLIYSNSTGYYGGGFYMDSSDDVSVRANQIHDNLAGVWGGGVHVNVCQQLTLENNMVVDNQVLATGNGAGIYAQRTNAQLLHNTIANNTGGHGQGIYATLTSSLQLANTIIVSHEIGVETGPTSTVSLDHTLWGAHGSNITDTLGAGIVTSNDMWLDPDFEAPGSGDYHITFVSPAKDAATDVGTTTDVDGESRVVNSPPDIGADEYGCHVRINDSPTPYPSVQAAIDAAANWDTVKVAGICRSLEFNASEWQVAYIANNLTLRGGYSTDFGKWNPEHYPTTLDAGGRGRVVYHNGEVMSRLESLWLVNGVDSFGSGVAVNDGYSVISGCYILNNLATNDGGGIHYAAPDDATLVNTVVADNRLVQEDGMGAGIAAFGGPVTMLHTTIARNTGGDGAGVTAVDATILMTNTILVDHTVGISTATAGTAVSLESTLWGSSDWANDLDWTGPGSVISANDYWNEPGFVDADDGDYHLAPDSPAIDLGVDAGVNTDIDGHARPVGPSPDLGADEARLRAFLPLVLRSH